ncbi:MAG: TIGR03087 family PEP-CTERM/XrtA system glycosyltransferase [Planctomycetaceae bacterium]|nr:TIGR03087 family PEP-CTERM/XrtA system glycosyltransferase [Planctomycetaceae bacterium]
MRPNLLYLVHRIPYPPNRGDRIRSYHLLKFLAERANVSLACLADETPEPGAIEVLKSLCRRVCVQPLGKSRWIRGIQSLACGRSATEGLFYSPHLYATVRSWCREAKFDRVVAFCSGTAPYLRIPELAGVPLVMDMVDVDSEKFRDYSRTARGLKKYLYALEARRLRTLETQLGQRAQVVTFVSDAEAEIYRRFAGSARVQAVGNGVDLDYFRPDPESEAKNGPVCVFVGALDYAVNIDGIQWFCQNVWPRITAQQPDAVLWLVGRRPVRAVQQMESIPGVRVAGDVPDVRPYYRRAAVSVSPLRHARGVQNKVLESFAMGKAVVASPQSLEGLSAQDGVHGLPAETPDDWVNTITDLFHHLDRRRRLGQAARRLVETEYVWDATLAPFSKYFDCGEQREANIESLLTSNT